MLEGAVKFCRRDTDDRVLDAEFMLKLQPDPEVIGEDGLQCFGHMCSV